jgi:mxaL protein
VSPPLFAFLERYALLPVVFGLLIVAVINPTVTLERPRYNFLFVLDITQSMNVVDVTLDGERVPRLTLAREAIRRTLRELPCESRAGLAVFTEHRSLMLFTPVEVCRNVGAVETTLATLDWRLAWVSRSEVAKGLYSGMRALVQMDEGSRLVFVTDGHEAPPVPEEFKVPLEQYADEVDGLVVGVGGSVPVPIPILSDEGEVVSYWRAEDVQQVDNYRLGRRGTVAFEGADAEKLEAQIAAGTEHLSSLRGDYLRALSARAGLDYLELSSPAALTRELRSARYADSATVEVPIGLALGLLALSLLLLYLFMPLLGLRLTQRRA